MKEIIKNLENKQTVWAVIWMIELLLIVVIYLVLLKIFDLNKIHPFWPMLVGLLVSIPFAIVLFKTERQIRKLEKEI